MSVRPDVIRLLTLSSQVSEAKPLLGSDNPCSAPNRPTLFETAAYGSAKRPSIELTAVASGVLRRRQRSSELPPLGYFDGGSGRDASFRPPAATDAGMFGLYHAFPQHGGHHW